MIPVKSSSAGGSRGRLSAGSPPSTCGGFQRQPSWLFLNPTIVPDWQCHIKGWTEKTAADGFHFRRQFVPMFHLTGRRWERMPPRRERRRVANVADRNLRAAARTSSVALNITGQLILVSAETPRRCKTDPAGLKKPGRQFNCDGDAARKWWIHQRKVCVQFAASLIEKRRNKLHARQKHTFALIYIGG